MEAARVGDTINWGGYEARVGYGHSLELVYEGKTKEEWIKHELETRGAYYANELEADVKAGRMTADEATEALEFFADEVKGEAEFIYTTDVEQYYAHHARHYLHVADLSPLRHID